MESKRTDNEDSINIDIVNVVKPTVKPSAEMAKMEESKKDNSFSINSTSATITKPKIGSGTTFHAVIASSKVKSSEVSIS
jgi:hypothetical protein